MSVNSELHSIPVVAIGDSMVAGLGDGEGCGWPGRLVRRASAEGLDVHVSNLGVRGDTGPMVTARWEEVDRRLLAWPGSLVVAGFGLNDVMVPRRPAAGGGERATEHETLTALRSMARCAPEGRLAVIGPPPTAWPEVDERVRVRSARMGQVCGELGVLFVPTFEALTADAGWRRAVAAGDGAHPDAAGWDRFAEVVTPPLIDWIRRSR